MATLRSGIGDLVNDLGQVMDRAADPRVKRRVWTQIVKLKALWDEVIRAQNLAARQTYAPAIAAVKDAQTAAKAALADVQKVEKAIDAAKKAAKRIDTVLELFTLLP